MKKPIEYGEYKEIINILERDNVEDSYQDLMGKEKQVLDTVNKVVKYYRDEDIKAEEFVNQGLGVIYTRFFEVWKDIIDEFTRLGSSSKYTLDIFTKHDRPIYIGISLILVALFLFFIESSKW